MERPTRRSGPEVISLSEFRQITRPKPRKNKFNAKKTSVGDVVLDSSGEAKRYQQLILLERAGVVRDLKRQVQFPLTVNGRQIATQDKLGRKFPLSYVADFTYFESGKYVIEDFKGFDTPTSRLKRAIIEAVLGVEIRITR
ncbi:MAG: hypothetical protein DI537_05455 [Stutzerimonas stutzeri]|nr:MAG: hypothetical protein DI537_05455 [Stutzerimonas stutzeri]